MSLSLVPKSEPSPKERVRQRVRAHPKPEGMLSCPECGGRSSVTVENGAVVKNGRKTRGTIIVKDCCDDCRMNGRIVLMRSGDEKPKPAT